MRPVFEDLFVAAGRRLDDYLDLLAVAPLTRYLYSGGTVLDATRDLPRMLAQIRTPDERDAEGYLAYLSYVTQLHRVTGPALIYGAPPNNAMAAFRRPPVRDPRVTGLYFAGGTTHPGGGVPMVVSSGRLAAREILADRLGR